MLIKQYLQVNIGDWLPNLGEYFYCGEVYWLLFKLLEIECAAGECI